MQSDKNDPNSDMRLTSLADYAVVMMAAAARHPAGARLSATLLAGNTGVPLPTAQKLMGRLAQAGLLTSARGTGGGFQLARPAGGISLADIIEAVEGPIAMTNCVDERRHDCALDAHCQVKPHLSIVNGVVRGALAAVTLEHLTQSVRPDPEPSRRIEGPSFSSSPVQEGQGFKLSPNAVGLQV